MSWSNEQISLLINLYKNYPCLYVMKNKDYHNRKLRNSALQKIAEGLKHLRPKTIEAEVQKKFMGLRTTYSSERKKVLESMHGDKEVSCLLKKIIYCNNMHRFIHRGYGITIKWNF